MKDNEVLPAASKPHVSAPVVATHQDMSSFNQMVERVVTDPKADLDKLERLLGMRERIFSQQATMAYDLAKAAAQAEISAIGPIARTKQGNNSKYAELGTILDKIAPIYTRHGFAMSFDTLPAEPGLMHVKCIVSHLGGHREEHNAVLPISTKSQQGTKDIMTATQAFGSGTSYARRYLTGLIWNVALGGEDDDGHAAGVDPDNSLTSEQVKEVQDAARNAGVAIERVLEVARVTSIKMIQPNRLQACLNWIENNASAEAVEVDDVLEGSLEPRPGTEPGDFDFDEDKPAY